jgi:hypothetical protein
VIVALEKPPAGQGLEIILLTPREGGGNLPKGMEAAWEDACVQMGGLKVLGKNNLVFDAEAERKSFKGWSYVRATGVMQAKANNAQYVMEIYVIDVNGRLERVVVTSALHTHNVTKLSLFDSPPHRRMVQEFVFGMKFDDWKDAMVEKGSVKGEGIVGVWQGISMFGGEFKAAYAIFYSNGQVFFGSRFPMAGCDGQDTFLEAELTPRYWGTYKFGKDGGMIQMSYGEIPVRAKGDKLVLTTNKTEHIFGRVESVDGAKFDGTFVMAESYEKIPVISFTAAGRFDDKGALRALDHDYTNVFAVPREPGSGTYSVKDHTVTFRYDDGRVYLLAYPGTDYVKGEAGPGKMMLGFHEDTLTRK